MERKSKGQSSIRRKLTHVIVGVSVAVVLLTAVGFSYNSFQILKHALIAEVVTVAQVIGDNSTASLTFRSREDAQQTLVTLENKPDVRSAVLYDDKGAVLAQYARAGQKLDIPLAIPEGPRHKIEDGTLTVFEPVLLHGSRVGTVWISSTTDRLTRALRDQALFALLMTLGCVGVSVVLSTIFQRRFTWPIESLVATADRVARDNNYELRAVKWTNDELGTLVERFNAMLSQIAARDRELRSAHGELELRLTELRQEVRLRQAVELQLLERKYELERVNDRLARSNRDLDEFAYVASHDLQEPLRKIQTFSNRMKQRFGAQLEPTAVQYLDIMLDASTRMRALIEDLLTLSRVTARGQPFTSVDLNVVAGKVVGDLEVKVHELGATIDVGPLPSVHADPNQMYRLFQNLIGNSLKYHRKGTAPEVTIRAEGLAERSERGVRSPALCRISFQDNGIGFENKYAEQIFKPFERLHGREEYSGTGIGLAICAKIVERHNGRIQARSVPGEGSRFEVDLPATGSIEVSDDQRAA